LLAGGLLVFLDRRFAVPYLFMGVGGEANMTWGKFGAGFSVASLVVHLVSSCSAREWRFFLFMVVQGEGGMTSAQPVGNLCCRALTGIPMVPETKPALLTVQPIMLTSSFLGSGVFLSVYSCSWLP
jgi:hypothetical protein